MSLLLAIGVLELRIFIDGAGDHVEVKLLGLARAVIHVERKRIRVGIGQPFVDGEAVALGLGNLLALVVEEQLIDIMLGREAAEDFADLVIDHGVGLMVLAEHFEINAKGGPAHAEVRLPLQLHVAAGHRQRRIAPVLIGKGDGAVLGVHLLHRHVEHAAGGGRDGQEGAVGRLALFAKRRQHDAHDGVIALGGAAQHGIEPARLVIFRGAGEFIVEAEGIEEAPQHGVVVMAEAFIIAAKGIGHRGQRLVEVRLQEAAVRNIVGNLAHAVHVVGEAQKPGWNIRHGLEGAAHHGGARHFAEGADMGKARGAVAGFEQHFRLGRLALLDPRQKFPRFLERPGAAFKGGSGKDGVSHGITRSYSGKCPALLGMSHGFVNLCGRVNAFSGALDEEDAKGHDLRCPRRAHR